MPEGQRRLAYAEEFLIGELERNRFNTERAIEIYTFAIDNSVWAWVKDVTLGKLIYKDYLRSGLGKRFATELTEQFKKGSVVPPLLRTNGRLDDGCASCLAPNVGWWRSGSPELD